MAAAAPRVAFDKVQQFLAACTLMEGDLWCMIASSKRSGTSPPLDLQRTVEQQFPLDTSNGEDWMHPVSPQRIAEALDLLDHIRPGIVDPAGHKNSYYWLHLGANFKILSPSTGQPLPGQSRESFRLCDYSYGVPLGTNSLLLSIFEKTTLALNFCIPEVESANVSDVVTMLQQHLPIRLSTKHWKRWTPTKTGTYRSQRIPPP